MDGVIYDHVITNPDGEQQRIPTTGGACYSTNRRQGWEASRNYSLPAKTGPARAVLTERTKLSGVHAHFDSVCTPLPSFSLSACRPGADWAGRACVRRRLRPVLSPEVPSLRRAQDEVVAVAVAPGIDQGSGEEPVDLTKSGED